jgi:hypothetical protein
MGLIGPAAFSLETNVSMQCNAHDCFNASFCIWQTITADWRELRQRLLGVGSVLLLLPSEGRISLGFLLACTCQRKGANAKAQMRVPFNAFQRIPTNEARKRMSANWHV